MVATDDEATRALVGDPRSATVERVVVALRADPAARWSLGEMADLAG